MTHRTALVLGASGLIGSSLVPLLLASDRYEQVRVLVRKPLGIQHDKLDEHLVDFGDPESFAELMTAEDVFCCLGTTHKTASSFEAFYAVDYTLVHDLAQLAKSNGAEHFLMISSIGANPKASSRYLKTKGTIEQAIADLDFPRTSILRPSLLMGARKEYRLKEAFGAAFLQPLMPLMLGPLRKYRPIAAERVAKALCTLSERPEESLRVYQSDEIVEAAHSYK